MKKPKTFKIHCEACDTDKVVEIVHASSAVTGKYCSFECYAWGLKNRSESLSSFKEWDITGIN